MSDQRGVLLIELGVAIAIVVLLLLLSVPHMRFLHRYAVQMELKKLQTVYAYLQQQAIARNREYTLRFDTSRHAYTSDYFSDVLAQGVQFGLLPGALGPPSQPTKPVDDPVSYKGHQVLFSADGSITAGAVYLIDRGKTTMFALTSPIADVRYLRTYRHDNGRWTLMS